MRNWHYAVNGGKKGPVGEDEIVTLINSGKINSETLVWTEEFTEWKKLSDVKDVFSVPVMVKAPEKQLSPALALASMTLGILSVVCLGPPLAIPGLILGIIALVMIKKGTASGKGFAIAGIVTSLISVILAVIFLVLMFLISLSPALKNAIEKARKISGAHNSQVMTGVSYSGPD